jgi:hypothetical protein
MWSQPGLHFLAQQLPNEIFQRSFKIGDTNVSIDVKPLQLIELIQMCGIDFVSALSRSGSNGSHRRLANHRFTEAGGKRCCSCGKS